MGAVYHTPGAYERAIERWEGWSGDPDSGQARGEPRPVLEDHSGGHKPGEKLAGRGAKPPDDYTAPPAAQPSPASAPRMTAPKVTEDVAGGLVALIAYALILAYYQHGKAGVLSWLSAKFINKPTIGSAGGVTPSTPIAPAAPATPDLLKGGAKAA